jgi:hypothetical protein
MHHCEQASMSKQYEIWPIPWGIPEEKLVWVIRVKRFHEKANRVNASTST